MDKNTITGLSLITLILFVFYFINKPNREQLEAIKHQRDSLRQVEMIEQALRLSEEANDDIQEVSISIIEEETDSPEDEAEHLQKLQQIFGDMTPFIEGEQEFHILENAKVKITFINKGGRIYSVELKDYKTHDGKPLILFDGPENSFGFPFTHNTRVFNTNDLYFDLTSQNDSSIVFAIGTDANETLSFSYTLPEDDYITKFMVSTENLKYLITTPRNTIDFNWQVQAPAFEKNHSFERQHSGIYYKFHLDDMSNLKPTKSSSENLRTPVKWIAFKSQFFSSIFIAEDPFLSAYVASEVENDNSSPFLRYNTAETIVPIDFSIDQTLNFEFYFGPNHYYTLNSYDKSLELNRLLPLGWGIFGWINRFAIIPVFNILEKHISSYGIIILILTILIKLVLFPLTYKSYISTARMKVLKPQIDEINKRIPQEKAMERQQATMALYKKAGVNPMGGCLPMLLQMPILVAMFRFFPASIELRQQSFLWATDLSTYDSIFNLPFSIPIYGDHISLFTLLMATTNIIYSKMNSQMTQSSSQMPGMKSMMYMMPIMFLFIFNNYSSGLSYYYFISTLITIIQTLTIKSFVDEEKILKEMKINQKKTVKKSSFTERLEKMAREQQKLQSKRKR